MGQLAFTDENALDKLSAEHSLYDLTIMSTCHSIIAGAIEWKQEVFPTASEN